jgi:SAM-dependent methyltransferase
LRCPIKPDRDTVLERFQILVRESELKSEFNVAVVGGSENDLELKILRSLQKNFVITTLGIEKSEIFLDLNEVTIIDQTFDLVICSHVLEHVYNVANAMQNIISLMSPGGYLWINCPTSNRKHGSPEYFSSGYSAGILSSFFDIHKIESIEIKDLGSERNYKYVHMFQRWPKANDLQPRFTELFSRLFSIRISEVLNYIFRSVLILRWSKEIKFDSLYSTETYGFGRKIQ